MKQELLSEVNSIVEREEKRKREAEQSTAESTDKWRSAVDYIWLYNKICFSYY